MKTQKSCADLLLLKASDASKGRISKLRRSSSNIIITLHCAKVCNSKLRRFTSVNYSFFISWKNGEEKQ